MVRRRGSFLVALVLLSVGVFYLTLVSKKADFEVIHPQFVASNDIEIRRLHGVSLPISEAVGEKQCPGGATLMYDEYCVVSPNANETKNASGAGLVTLCTQGTVEFLQHVSVLCHRWHSPVSVAVYSPRDDYADARITAHLLRQCDACVRYWVSWHFFFPRGAGGGEPPSPAVDESQLTVEDCSSITDRLKRREKRRSRGTYPINVGRNVARRLTSTPFVFSIDIELYPSLDIPAKFERMLRSPSLDDNSSRVWVFPVFEVHSRSRAPLIKSGLRRLFNRKQAISFHQYRCNICHRIPNLTQWMAHGDLSISEVEESLEPLRIWTTVKRSRHLKLQEWEPFFIGTNKDPEFDIRLSWEGKQNKMQMAYEMCMRNYDFHIVENAFLVHTPGINVYNATKEKEREKYALQNRKVIREVKRKLIQKYGSKKDC